MAEVKNEKAPGRRFLADQTPLSAWSRQAPLIKLEWVAFDPRENAIVPGATAFADSFLRCNRDLKL
jgi:hypothetical protein